MAVVSDSAVLNLEEMVKVLDETENLTENLFELSEDNIEFLFDEDEDDPLQLKINSDTYKLSAEAAMQALAYAKIPKGVIDVYDIDIILPLVNWYYAEKGGELKALVKNKTVLAFTRPGTEIYSTVDIVKEMVRALDNFEITEYHFERVKHTLKETQFCLVAPHKTLELDDGDVLRAGIFVRHSVVGTKPLVMAGYISRDYSDNGMISDDVFEQWNRKSAKKSEDVEDEDHYDVYTWAYDTADTVIRAFKRDAGSVKDLQDLSIGNHAGTFFNDVFDRNSLPVAVRKLVREEYVDQPGQTLYDLWNAITLTADRSELEDNTSTQLKIMEAAGKLAAHPQSCPSCHRLTDDGDD